MPTNALSQAEFDTYVEEVCRHIAESSAVHTARVDAYLDGGFRAASQVSDVRLALEEQPAQPSGWDNWFDLAIVFLIESNMVGTALKSLTSTVFRALMKQNAIWLRIPRSPLGNELVSFANLTRGRTLIEPGRGRLTFNSVLDRGVAGMPGRTSGEALQLYHASIRRLVQVTEPLEIANGLAQVANQARQSSSAGRNDPLSATDMPGVAVISAMQDYARITRLGIQVRAARCIAFARTRAAVPDLAALSDGFLIDPLRVERTEASLRSISSASAIAAEALIWSRLYGFSLRDFSVSGRSGAGTPALGSNDQRPLIGVRVELIDYWLRRFGTEVGEWAASDMKWSEMPTQGRLARSIYLRAYFARISSDLTRLGKPAPGDLGALSLAP